MAPNLRAENICKYPFLLQSAAYFSNTPLDKTQKKLKGARQYHDIYIETQLKVNNVNATKATFLKIPSPFPLKSISRIFFSPLENTKDFLNIFHLFIKK